MSPHSEEFWARELAMAVLGVDRGNPSHEDIGALESALDALLYGYGSDGVHQLTISEEGAGQFRILASNFWLPDGSRLVEATFKLSVSGDAIDDFTVKVNESDDLSDWLVRELDPIVDDDWGLVLRYELGSGFRGPNSPEIRAIGRTSAPERALFLAELSYVEDWPITIAEPAPAFVVFSALDARGISPGALNMFAAKLLRQGCVYLCAWGPQSGRVQEETDAADKEVNPPAGRAMTSWHEEERIDEALYVALFDAFHKETEIDGLLAIVDPRWSEHVEARLRDPKQLHREIFGAEAE